MKVTVNSEVTYLCISDARQGARDRDYLRLVDLPVRLIIILIRANRYTSCIQ